MNLNLINPDLLARNPELASELRKRQKITLRQKQERLTRATTNPPGYRSQLEADYARDLALRGIAFHYEVLNLAIGEDLAYTPDFDYLDESGVFTVVELKGNSQMKNARDSLTRFKVAAALYPCWRWLWIEDGQTLYHYGA